MYAPIMLLMILNFSSYWIPDEAVLARITAIVTTLPTFTLTCKQPQIVLSKFLI